MIFDSLFPIAEREIKLYPWQLEAVQALRDNIDRKVRNQILAAPTGAGKTVIGAHLIRECGNKGKRALFVCDRRELIKQTSDTFYEYGIPHGVYMPDHVLDDPTGMEPILVASAQTILKRGWPRIHPNLIVVDEAHTNYGVTAERIQRRDCTTIGLTATPFSRGLGQLYDAVVNVRTLNQLTAEGYLVPFDAYAATEPDMSDAPVTAGEWSDKEREKRAMPIIGSAVNEYLEKAFPKKFIAFGVTVRHCEELLQQFMAAGINCALYVDGTPENIRNEIVRDFKDRNGPITGLISVAALAKGFDAPCVECIIMCRPLRSSLAEHIQILGRGLRRDPDNPEKRCIVLDHSGNMLRFWRQTQDFFEYGATHLDDGKPKPKNDQAKEAKEPEPYKCPNCTQLHAPRPTCPHCGHLYPPRRNNIEHLPGKLVALGSFLPESEVDLKQDVFGQLLYYAQEKKFKSGWAAYKFDMLFGEGSFEREFWRAAPRPPTQKTLNWILNLQIRDAKRSRSKAK